VRIERRRLCQPNEEERGPTAHTLRTIVASASGQIAFGSLEIIVGYWRQSAPMIGRFAPTSYARQNPRVRKAKSTTRLARTGRGGEAIISPPPTHAELTARVSSHREAVTGELNSPIRAGLLDRRRGALVLLDPAHLASTLRLRSAGGALVVALAASADGSALPGALACAVAAAVGVGLGRRVRRRRTAASLKINSLRPILDT
jgi:hypothetical protein